MKNETEFEEFAKYLILTVNASFYLCSRKTLTERFIIKIDFLGKRL